VTIGIHNRIVRAALAAYGGIEQGVRGDSFFAIFTSPSDAVAAVLQIKRELLGSEWPSGERLRIRMGLHTGEVTTTSSGLIGYEIHKAARIADIGHGDQILVSSAAAGLVEDWLGDGVSLRHLGSHRLKDLGRPESIFQLVVEGLRNDFPPLMSLDSPDMPNNLPASLSPFIGRRDEIDEVKSLVMGSRVVTLTGAGGCGKTRLALQSAAEMLDGTGEGVWLVELASLTDGSHVPLAILDALNAFLEGSGSPTDALISVLKDQYLLLVLDNCEHLLDDVAVLVDRVVRHCPRVHVLATSREPLGIDGEEVYLVRSMSLPEADEDEAEGVFVSDSVRLFVARAQSHDKTFQLVDENARAVASVCRRLDGIPLALELAAARLSTMALNDLHERLDERFHLLTGGSRTALPRQLTLEATVDWSYSFLSESERIVLRRLTVFVDGFALEAAETICSGGGVDAGEIADIIGSLVTKSLLIAERSPMAMRYRLLETIRQYAMERLAAAGKQEDAIEIGRRHADYFLARGESLAPELARGPLKVKLLRLVDEDRGNFLTALDSAAREPDGSSRVLRLGVAIGPYLQARYQLAPAGLMASALRTHVRRDHARARALFWVPWLAPDVIEEADRAVQLSRQLAMLTECGELAQELGDYELASAALSVRARRVSQSGDKERALELVEESLRIARDHELVWCAALALLHKGYVQCFHNSPRSTGSYGSDGAPALEESIELFRRAQDAVLLGRALQEYSLVPVVSQDLRRCREIKEEALRVAEEVGDTLIIFYAVSDLSHLNFVLGKPDLAEAQARQSLMLSRRLGVPGWQTTFTFNNLACCAATATEFERAATLLGGVENLDRLMPEYGFKWTDSEWSARADAAAASSAVLGEAEYERCVHEGRSMSYEQLVNVALRRTPSVA
jgi:predicted ATPase